MGMFSRSDEERFRASKAPYPEGICRRGVLFSFFIATWVSVMKYLFSACFLALAAASVATVLLRPHAQSDVPVLYWVTDVNPARMEQIRIFHEWLEKNGHPRFELRLDTANSDVFKMIIQGVSGVGGDIMDLWTGSGMRYFHQVGLLTDVTEWAEELGFDPSHTYRSMEPEITLDGRQYMFPCNVAVIMYWANKETFAKYKQPVPPRRWDFETFERLGKRFVEAANPPGKRHTVFFANLVLTQVLRRSLGLSTFNETLSRCTLDDPRNAQLLKRVYKWTYEDHILPSAADRESFATASGYGGTELQLFNSGNYAMFWMGRYALIQLRKFGALQLWVSEPPHGGFPNTITGTRAATIYIGSNHKELAKYFLAYLASEDYNMQIVNDADALPPNPIYTQIEEFRRPPTYPNEWGCHEVFAETAETIAIGGSYSPFVVPSVMQRIEQEAEQGFMSGIYSAEEAAQLAADRINDEIQRTLKENPKLKPLYDRLVERQNRIDQRRDEGRKVPLAWIENPFYRRYYAFKGWAE